MQAGHLLIQQFGQHIDLVVVLSRVAPQLNLGQYLVGEGVAHHKAGMPGGAAQVDQAALGQHDYALAVRKNHMIHLGFDVVPGQITDAGNIDFRIKVTDIAHNGLIGHGLHMGAGNHLQVAGAGDEDVAHRRGLLHGHHPVAFHGRLQGADGVNLGDQYCCPHAAQGLGAAFAHITISDHHGDLAGNHHVSGPLDAVDKRFTAAVEVVEFGFGNRIVHIKGRAEERLLAAHLVETVHTGGGFFRHPAHSAHQLRILLVHYQGEVAAVIKEHVRPPVVRPEDGLLNAPPKFLLGLSLPGKGGDTCGHHGGCGVILGGKDVAGRPAQISPQMHQGFHKHRSLDGHVQTSGNACTLERLVPAELFPQGHQPGHLCFGNGYFLAAPISQVEVCYLVVCHICFLIRFVLLLILEQSRHRKGFDMGLELQASGVA